MCPPGLLSQGWDAPRDSAAIISGSRLPLAAAKDISLSRPAGITGLLDPHFIYVPWTFSRPGVGGNIENRTC